MTNLPPGREATSTLTVDEALDRVLAAFTPLPAVETPLDRALGLILARDVVAKGDLPPFDNSAMDGFALRTADTEAASAKSPVSLQVVGDVPAGHAPSGRPAVGQAMRIMTGAPIPEGADAVERVENTEPLAAGEGRERVVLHRPVKRGANIRPAGEDARAGAVVLQAGAWLHPGAIGLLAATGHASVPVHRRPRVGVLVTGDEIVAPGDPLGPGHIWNSNGPMIAAQIRQCGGDPVQLGVVTDSVDALRSGIARAGDLDLLVTTGGVSVGAFDIVKDVLRADGKVDLWHLLIRPGKPLAFGRLGGMPVLGLPGNPVAAAVAFWQFGRAAILTMLDHAEVAMPEIEARLCDRIENRGGRRQYARVDVTREGDGYTARLSGGQGSAMLTSLARADGLLVVPESCEVAEPGTVMRVQLPYRD